MNIKISEMPQATNVGGNDIIPIVQSGVSKKANVCQLNNYSTTEQVVGTWIDGKPLYEKTYVGNAPIVATNGTWVSVKLPTPDNFELGFVKYAFCVDASNQYLVLPFITNGGYLLKTYFGNDGGDWLILSSNYTGTSNQTCYITIAYTKTTDSATRSTQLTRSIEQNSGELVGIGNKAEINIDEKTENVPVDLLDNKTTGVIPEKNENESGDTK